MSKKLNVVETSWRCGIWLSRLKVWNIVEFGDIRVKSVELRGVCVEAIKEAIRRMDYIKKIKIIVKSHEILKKGTPCSTNYFFCLP